MNEIGQAITIRSENFSLRIYVVLNRISDDSIKYQMIFTDTSSIHMRHLAVLTNF